MLFEAARLVGIVLVEHHLEYAAVELVVAASQGHEGGNKVLRFLKVQRAAAIRVESVPNVFNQNIERVVVFFTQFGGYLLIGGACIASLTIRSRGLIAPLVPARFVQQYRLGPFLFELSGRL